VSTVSTQLSHVYPLGARVNARGHLEIGGCDAVELAHEFGTPAFVVSEDDLRARARAFADGLRARHPDGDVLFASKAFPCTAVYRVLAEEGLACDVASGGELALALAGGFDPRRIYLHGNAKSQDELREALDAGVGHIVLDSFDDFDRLERVAAAAGRVQEVLIRVNPNVAGETHDAISTGQADTCGSSACTATSARSCSTCDRSATRSRRSLSSASSTCTTWGAASGSRTPWIPSHPRSRTTWRRSSTPRTGRSGPASGS
jgi:diaminopimelate decarboxylase